LLLLLWAHAALLPTAEKARPHALSEAARHTLVKAATDGPGGGWCPCSRGYRLSLALSVLLHRSRSSILQPKPESGDASSRTL